MVNYKQKNKKIQCAYNKLIVVNEVKYCTNLRVSLKNLDLMNLEEAGLIQKLVTQNYVRTIIGQYLCAKL